MKEGIWREGLEEVSEPSGGVFCDEAVPEEFSLILVAFKGSFS